MTDTIAQHWKNASIAAQDDDELRDASYAAYNPNPIAIGNVTILLFTDNSSALYVENSAALCDDLKDLYDALLDPTAFDPPLPIQEETRSEFRSFLKEKGIEFPR